MIWLLGACNSAAGAFPSLAVPLAEAQAALRRAYERTAATLRVRVIDDDLQAEEPNYDVARSFVHAAKPKGAKVTIKQRDVFWQEIWSEGWQFEIIGEDWIPLFAERRCVNIDDEDAAKLVPLDQDIADRIRRAAVDDLPAILTHAKVPHAL